MPPAAPSAGPRAAATAPAARASVVVHLAGTPRLAFGRDGESLLDRKSAALLALAHLEPGITRSTVARWLWPDSDGPAARANLRVLLFRLTKLAGCVLVPPGSFVTLDPGVPVLDEAALLRSIALSRGEWLALPPLLDGVELDDLPEMQAWLDRARRRMSERLDAALRERIAELEHDGSLDAAAALAQRLVEFDPNAESAYRTLMRVQIARGERSAALAAFERCRHRLSEELGVAPSPATLALHAQALRIEASSPPSAPPRAAADADADTRGGAPAQDDADDARPVLELCRRIERIMGERAGDSAELERLAHLAALRLPAPELTPDQQAYTCGIVARHHLRAGRNADAAIWSEQAVAAARRASPERLCWALGQRANVALEAFDVGRACELLAEAERLARDLEQPDKLSRVWHQIGTMLLAAGLLDEAETAMRRSIALHEATCDHADEEAAARLPAMRINLAACLMDQHRYAQAEAVLDRTLADADKRRGLRFRELRLVALLCLGYIHRIEDRVGQARTALALARHEIDAVTMQRNRLFAELYERLLEQVDAGAAAAQRTLDWVLAVDSPDAMRIHLLRDLAAVCLHDGIADVAARAHEHEARLRVSRCRAVQRGLGRRWLRAFGADAAPAAPGEPARAETLPPEFDVIERMGTLAELREGRDGRHGARVGELAGQLARRVGVPEPLAGRIAQAARLHDIGKVALADAPRPVDAARAGEVRAPADRHADLGAMLLAGHPHPIVRLAETIAQQHHEHWDGGGAPLGLAGAAIALPARIVAVADLFDRACQHGGAAQALAQVDAAAGSVLDPQLAAAFVQMHRRGAAPPAPSAAPTLLDAASGLIDAIRSARAPAGSAG